MESEEPQELHPAVQLLLKRMDSHPEEFAARGMYRWESIYSDINQVASQSEKQAMKAKLRAIKMEAIHKRMMEQLLTEDVDEQEHEYERNILKALQVQQQAQQTALQNSMIPLHNYQNAYPPGTIVGTPSGSFGKPMTGIGLVEKIKTGLGIK